MRSLQPTLKNGRNVWDPAALPATEFQDRLERVREAMVRERLDLLVVCGRAFDDKADPCYLSNYVIRLPKSTLMAVPASGPPALFFEGGSRGLPSMRKTTWVEDLRACPGVVEALAAYLGERERPQRIGLVGARRLLPHGQYRALVALLEGSETVPADGLLAGLRAVKSDREIARVRAAGAIVRSMFEHLETARFDPPRESAIEAEIRRGARRRGGEDVRMMVAHLTGGFSSPRPAEDRPVAAGDRIGIYLACEYERYWAAGLRTLTFDDRAFAPVAGDADTRAKLRAAVAPGRAVAGVARALGEVPGELGLDPAPGHGLGQGIGLALAEAPWLREDAGGELRAGNCLALELAAAGSDSGILAGDTVVVTAGGAEVVTDVERGRESAVRGRI